MNSLHFIINNYIINIYVCIFINTFTPRKEVIPLERAYLQGMQTKEKETTENMEA